MVRIDMSSLPFSNSTTQRRLQVVERTYPESFSDAGNDATSAAGDAFRCASRLSSRLNAASLSSSCGTPSPTGWSPIAGSGLSKSVDAARPGSWACSAMD